MNFTEQFRLSHKLPNINGRKGSKKFSVSQSKASITQSRDSRYSSQTPKRVRNSILVQSPKLSQREKRLNPTRKERRKASVFSVSSQVKINPSKKRRQSITKSMFIAQNKAFRGEGQSPRTKEKDSKILKKFQKKMFPLRNEIRRNQNFSKSLEVRKRLKRLNSKISSKESFR